MSKVVDMHSHFYPNNMPDWAQKFGGEWPGFRDAGSGKGMMTLGAKDYRPIYEACWNPAVRIEEMGESGIDVQIMSATPLLFSYEKPIEQAERVAQFYNDAALEYCAHDPLRLRALSQVPMQNIDVACKEVSRCAKNGHVGVQIGNHIGLKNLDDEGIITFLQHCAAENVSVLIHPWDMMAQERMPKYMLQWLVGMPAETQLSILSLIMSGAFERLPESLKICFAHGGGSFAFLLGRVDNAWTHRDIVREDCPQIPSSYTNRFYVDSAVFNERALQMLVDVMGEDRVMLGSDYPFPLGEKKIGGLVRGSKTLQDSSKAMILGGNAHHFFDL